MDTLTLSIYFREDKKKELVQMCRLAADETGNSEGCLGCQVYVEPEDGDSITFTLNWATHDALINYFSSENFIALLGAMKFLGKYFEVTINNGTPEEGISTVETARKKTDD